MSSPNEPIAIIGGGIGGLTLALSLHQAGIAARVYEAAPSILPLGVGVNLLPHAMRELDELGLGVELEALGVATREASFFNRFGQLIYTEPLGRHAGYDWPQVSIHRGDLQQTLLNTCHARLGEAAVVTDAKLVRAHSQADGVVLELTNAAGESQAAQARLVIACDGIHSVVRHQFFPAEGAPVYSGVNMWRGTTVGLPHLSGATMVRAGWLSVGKMVIYPIRQLPGGQQLINWVAEVEQPVAARHGWAFEGVLEQFLPTFADWHFDWLDIPALIQGAKRVLEYPMVDRDPLPTWVLGEHRNITLLGDAAHPMVPRGSNGAGQAIIDARSLAGHLQRHGVNPAALAAYDAERRPATAKVVLANRTTPPDAVLRHVHERSGDRPFHNIDALIPPHEFSAITSAYKKTAGYDGETLRNRPSYLS